MPYTPTIYTATDGRKYFDLPSNFRTARQNECIIGLDGQTTGVDASIDTTGFFNISIVHLADDGWHYHLNIQNRRQAIKSDGSLWKIPTTSTSELSSHRVYFRHHIDAIVSNTEASEIQSTVSLSEINILANEQSTVILQLKNSDGENLSSNSGVVGVTWSSVPSGVSFSNTVLHDDGTITATATSLVTGSYEIDYDLEFEEE